MEKTGPINRPDPQTFRTNSLFAGEANDEWGRASGDLKHRLSQEELHGLLRSPRRRFVLWYLQHVEEPVSLGELAEEIAGWENEKPVEAVDSDERKRVYVGLYQCHLTKLDAADIVDFNESRKVVSRGPNYDSLRRVGAFVPEGDDVRGEPNSFLRYYVLAAVTSLALLGTSLLVTGSFGLVPTALVLFVTGSFGLVSAVEAYQTVENPVETVADSLGLR